LQSAHDGPLLVVVRRPSEVDDFAADLLGFAGQAPEVLPAWDSLPSDRVVTDPIYGGRLRVLARMSDANAPSLIVTSLPALMQPVPAKAERAQGTRRLRVGEDLETEELLRWLVDRGFERVPAIEVPGEFSLHGGILDLYPADVEDPIRVELFGDTIDSIR